MIDYPRCKTCRFFINDKGVPMVCTMGVSVNGSVPFGDFGCAHHEPKPDWIDKCVESWDGSGERSERLAEHIRRHYNAAKEREEA